MPDVPLDMDPASLAGLPARSADGRGLGDVEAAFGAADRSSSRFVGLLLREGMVVVPVDGATLDGGVLHLPFTADQIAAGPVVPDETAQIDEGTADRVGDHFSRGGETTTQVAVPPPPTAPMPAPGAEPAAAEPAAEVVLSEEQLVVETERVPTGRVRLRKEIVEEEVALTVVLRRQELVIEREPIDDDSALVQRDGTGPGAAGDGEELEIVLWAEEPVITTRAVPVERVRVRGE